MRIFFPWVDTYKQNHWNLRRNYDNISVIQIQMFNQKVKINKKIPMNQKNYWKKITVIYVTWKVKTHQKSMPWIKDKFILLSTTPHTFDRIAVLWLTNFYTFLNKKLFDNLSLIRCLLSSFNYCNWILFSQSSIVNIVSSLIIFNLF